jgi:hypothetical protein
MKVFLKFFFIATNQVSLFVSQNDFHKYKIEYIQMYECLSI